jgi:hypothetical protein
MTRIAIHDKTVRDGTRLPPHAPRIRQLPAGGSGVELASRAT